MAKKLVSYAIFWVIISFATISIWWFGLFSNFEHQFQDKLFAAKPFSKNIVILAIDDTSINNIGTWPWPRKIFAEALLTLERLKPKSVGLDIVLSNHSQFGNADDETLQSTIQSLSYPLVLPKDPPPLFADSHITLGDISLTIDPDGTIRQFPPQEDNFGSVITLLEKQAESERIVFSNSKKDIQVISFKDFLNGNFSIDLQDKYILIGSTAQSLHDFQKTPTSPAMPGIFIHAEIVNMLLSRYTLNEISSYLSILLIILSTSIPVILFLIFKKIRYVFTLSLSYGILILLIQIVAFDYGHILPIAYPHCAWIFSLLIFFIYKRYLENKEKKLLTQLFEKYVSKEVLETIITQPEKVTLGGEEREITILFVDIRGFTSLSEKTDPQKLVSILNTYFSEMSNIIMNHGGVIDKFIGDAIMAFWNAPLANPDHAKNAIMASLEMLEKLKIINQSLTKPLQIGIGIHTGKAIVGNIGSHDRFDYTVIGDTVNVGSRVEGLCKDYSAQLIVTESTKKNSGLLEENFIYLGEAYVKGREQALKIYTFSEKEIE